TIASKASTPMASGLRPTHEKTLAIGGVCVNRIGKGQSTLNLLTHLSGADAAVLDDRALNKQPFAMDTSGHRAQTVSTLDIIEELTSRGVVNEGERRSLRYRLRIGGAMLIPADG